MSRSKRRGKRKGIFDIFREKAEKIIEEVADEVQKQQDKKAEDVECEDDTINLEDYPKPDVLPREEVEVPPKPEIDIPEPPTAEVPPIPEVQIPEPPKTEEAVAIAEDPKKDLEFPNINDILGEDKNSDLEDIYDDLKTTIPRDKVKDIQENHQPESKPTKPKVPRQDKDITSQIGKRLNKMKDRYVERHMALIIEHREEYLQMVMKHRALEEALLAQQEKEEQGIAQQHEQELTQAKDMVRNHIATKGQVTKGDLKEVKIVIRSNRKSEENKGKGKNRGRGRSGRGGRGRIKLRGLRRKNNKDS